MTNLRIQVINEVIESESLSPRTTIMWDPTNNTGQVLFQCARYFRMTGTENYFGAPVEDGVVSINLQTLLQQVITVQTPQGPVDVPATLIMGAVKTLFDQLYNTDRQPPVTLPQP